MPYPKYQDLGNVNESVISGANRATMRPLRAALYAHYSSFKDLNTSYPRVHHDYWLDEGGGGNYSSTSGYDQLSFGTILYHLE